MLTQEQIKECQDEAKKKFNEKVRKAEVEKRIKILEARKAHLFPKRVRFQWPMRFEDWVKPNGCKR